MNKERFNATTKYYMELRHITTREKLRAHTTCGSSTTFRKYFNDPDKMPIGVFVDIMTALKVPYEERFELLKEK